MFTPAARVYFFSPSSLPYHTRWMELISSRELQDYELRFFLSKIFITKPSFGQGGFLLSVPNLNMLLIPYFTKSFEILM